jgi:hypothetical protein
VKNSLAPAIVRGAGFHAVVAPPRGMTTRNATFVVLRRSNGHDRARSLMLPDAAI